MEESVGRTLAEKVWHNHVVRSAEGEPDLLYIDLHLVHEVTSPQAFDGLRGADRPVRRPDLTVATEDHNIPTIDVDKPIADPVSRAQRIEHSPQFVDGSTRASYAATACRRRRRRHKGRFFPPRETPGR